MSKISIAEIDKAELLAALYNNSKPLGMGFVHFTPEDMTLSEAQELLMDDTYFDYLKGRVMKVELAGDELSTFLYNRDNGQGVAEKIVCSLKNNMRRK